MIRRSLASGCSLVALVPRQELVHLALRYASSVRDVSLRQGNEKSGNAIETLRFRRSLMTPTVRQR